MLPIGAIDYRGVGFDYPTQHVVAMRITIARTASTFVAATLMATVGSVATRAPPPSSLPLRLRAKTGGAFLGCGVGRREGAGGGGGRRRREDEGEPAAAHDLLLAVVQARRALHVLER